MSSANNTYGTVRTDRFKRIDLNSIFIYLTTTTCQCTTYDHTGTHNRCSTTTTIFHDYDVRSTGTSTYNT